MMFSRRKHFFIIISLIVFSQNIYSVQERFHECQALFAPIRKAFQPQSKKMKIERDFILSEPVKYHGPGGYEIYIQENPKSLLKGNLTIVFSKEDLELLEWHYIEYGNTNFGKITQITGHTVLVDYIDNKSGIETKTLNQNQIRTARPSSIAKGRLKFISALRKMKFTEDERYIKIPSRHLPDQYGRVLEVQTGGFVIAEIIGYNGKLKKVQLSQNHLLRAEVDPVSKNWFNRFEHSIEKLKPLYPLQKTKEDDMQPESNPEFLHVFSDNVEDVLTKQSYTHFLIEGVNETAKQIRLAEYIRSFNINPFSTHIEDFALQITNHIEIIRQGIESQGIAKERLLLLKHFEKEAHQKIEDSTVTYMWWLFWNKRLSILATPPSQRQETGDWWKSEKNLEHFLDHLNEDQSNELHKDEYVLMKLVQKFPDQIILPTMSNLGPIALNQASVHSVIFVQLTEQVKWMDGSLNTPEKVFSHGMDHVFLKFEQEEGASSPSLMKLFYQQAVDAEGLTIYEKEVIEIIYFLITHENKPTNIEQPQAIINMMIDKNTVNHFQNINNLRNWIEENIENEDDTFQSYLYKMAKVFNRSSAAILEKIHD